MLFLQRFVKKIVIKVKKERWNFNKVKVEDIEFNLTSEYSLEKLKKFQRNKGKSYKKISVRKTLKNGSQKKSGIAKNFVTTRKF